MVRRRKGRSINGIVLVNKPEGSSSNAILQHARRLFDANKGGHTGSLDPLATGMLPICFGAATKFSQFGLNALKCYQCTVQLGTVTTTGDSEGDVVRESPVPAFGQADLIRYLTPFIGTTKQQPSLYSALKFEGKPLYYYARQGIDVPRPIRDITLFRISLLSFSETSVRLEVVCSKGTYIRSLAEDFGDALGCGAHLTQLHRVYSAPFYRSPMHTIDALEAMTEEARMLKLLPIETFLDEYPALTVSEEEARRLAFGQTVVDTAFASAFAEHVNTDTLASNNLKVEKLLVCQHETFLETLSMTATELSLYFQHDTEAPAFAVRVLDHRGHCLGVADLVGDKLKLNKHIVAE